MQTQAFTCTASERIHKHSCRCVCVWWVTLTLFSLFIFFAVSFFTQIPMYPAVFTCYIQNIIIKGFFKQCVFVRGVCTSVQVLKNKSHWLREMRKCFVLFVGTVCFVSDQPVVQGSTIILRHHCYAEQEMKHIILHSQDRTADWLLCLKTKKQLEVQSLSLFSELMLEIFLSASQITLPTLPLQNMTKYYK